MIGASMTVAIQCTLHKPSATATWRKLDKIVCEILQIYGTSPYQVNVHIDATLTLREAQSPLMYSTLQRNDSFAVLRWTVGAVT